jgi:hypothetical protein
LHDYLGGQNTLDLAAITFQSVYALLRIRYPFGSHLESDKFEDITEVLSATGLSVFNAMPIMHLISMTLMFL